jgi:hypothetical protein
MKKNQMLGSDPIRISRIRIGMPWMLILIQIWIWQNDADPTRSGSTCNKGMQLRNKG